MRISPHWAACAAAVCLLTACSQQAAQVDAPASVQVEAVSEAAARTAETTSSSAPPTELVWPSGSYAQLSAAGQESYRAELESQLQPDEYVVLEGGDVVQSPDGGHYTPQQLAEAWPQVEVLPAVGNYSLVRIEIGCAEAPNAPEGQVQRYVRTRENIRGVTLVYQGGEDEADTVRVCYIGCGAPSEDVLPAPQAFAGSVQAYDTEEGVCYGIQAPCSAGGVVQVNAAAEDEAAFAQKAEPFAEQIGQLIVFQ